MGTPEVAVPTLQFLIDSPHQVLGVVAQPDRPVGRGMKMHSPPTIELAKKNKLATFQPETLKDEKVVQSWRDLNLDVIIVIAYGKFLPQSILDLTPHGCINVHFSLLPKYRGAAPINWAIMNNDGVTGVTTMLITPKMDAGPILKQQDTPILPEDTTTILGHRLANMGAGLLRETLSDLLAGKLKPHKQNESDVVLAPQLKKEDGLINWNQSASLIVKHILGTTPWPGAYTFLHHQEGDVDKTRLKVYSSEAVGQGTHENPGTILNITPHGLEVACTHGVILLTEVQPEGKRRMSTIDYVNGHQVKIGMRFC
jgi:methionyl-tRNA formyltransferase